jgi:hypothetical protein
LDSLCAPQRPSATGLYLDASGREKHVINQLARLSLRNVKIGKRCSR